MKAIKKPIEVEVMEYTGNNGWQINKWSNNEVVESQVLEPNTENPRGCYLQIHTLEGIMCAIVGDFIIRGINGEYYPCKPDIFNKTYDIIGE